MTANETAGDIVNGSGNTVSAGYGVVPRTSNKGSVFLVGPSAPEWRKIVKIEDGKTVVVQDWKRLDKATREALEAALEEMADSDDGPEQQQLLMSAWQSLAMYLASCDDEDKAGAANALKVVTNLMNDNGGDGPTPTSTFGMTMQAAADSFSCEKCSGRAFSSQQGLINHLKSVHNQREKTGGYKKNSPDQDKD